MKRRTFIAVVSIISIATFGYFGSALRPFLIEPGIKIGPEIPADAVTAIHRTCAFHRLGIKKPLTFSAYMEALRNPKSHKVEPVSVRMVAENKIVVHDPNRGMESLLKNLEGTWEQGSYGMAEGPDGIYN
ncbi:hypothetical protein [Haloferula sp. BvORR071]|uniref:hypothetical protein n=1 Tax=Haloferula sp. BvORR071 TaxID=1396141 RepID=UPI0005549D2F|nr:hypothetical protein [Haloferula sp. BvORR071]